jgi:hypothetical protein
VRLVSREVIDIVLIESEKYVNRVIHSTYFRVDQDSGKERKVQGETRTVVCDLGGDSSDIRLD